MAEFYVEKQANDTGVHLVHTATCSSLPKVETLRYLGVYSNSKSPLNEAGDWYPPASLCPACLAAS